MSEMVSTPSWALAPNAICSSDSSSCSDLSAELTGHIRNGEFTYGKFPFVFMRNRALLLLLALLGFHTTARAEAPNIIVITVDTTRADRMGFLGSKRGSTPNLDVLARQGIVFERAYSQAPLTPVSHATLFPAPY